MTTNLKTPTISVDAGNDIPPIGPHHQYATSVGVSGENFTPNGQAILAVKAGTRVIRGTVDVDQNGHFVWVRTVQPQLNCAATVTAEARDGTNGTRTHGAADVFCP